MYGVDLYRRVRLACHHEGLSQREAARRFGIDRKTVATMMSVTCDRQRLRNPISACGDSPSDIAVKLAMSENKAVSSRVSPPSAGGRALPSAGHDHSTSAENTYPAPRTVLIRTGLRRSISIFCRSRATRVSMLRSNGYIVRP